MELEDIFYKNKKLGYVIRGHLDNPGRKFPSQEEDNLQVGILNLREDEWIEPHIHKETGRKLNATHKVIFVVEGKMAFYFYNEDKKKIKEVLVEKGDLIMLMNGGFGFKALEDNTKIIEIKQGPYPGLENDKIKFEPENYE